MEIVLMKRAANGLARMPRSDEMLRRLEAVAADPFARHGGVKRLKGIENGFRLRLGDWRALYEVDGDTNTVYVTRVERRGDAYRIF